MMALLHRNDGSHNRYAEANVAGNAGLNTASLMEWVIGRLNCSS